MQKIEKLREEIRVKFDTQKKISDGVKIAFRQSDGTKTEHIFSKTSTVKVSCLVKIYTCIDVCFVS